MKPGNGEGFAPGSTLASSAPMSRAPLSAHGETRRIDTHSSLNIIGGACRFRSSSRHQADNDTGAGERWRLTAFLLLGPCRCERAGVAHIVPGGLDPAVGALDV